MHADGAAWRAQELEGCLGRPAPPLPGSVLQAPRGAGRRGPAGKEIRLRLSRNSYYCLVPHLLEPIKPCTMGNYRLPEAQSREAGDVQWVGEVLLAHRSRHVGLAAREGGCRHQGPHKLTPEQAAFTGILGGGMTSPGAGWGGPGPFFFSGACLCGCGGTSFVKWMTSFGTSAPNGFCSLWSCQASFKQSQPAPWSPFQSLWDRPSGPP